MENEIIDMHTRVTSEELERLLLDPWSGYIISYWGGEGAGARRRYYSITVEGRNRLAEDLAAWKETRKVLDTLLGEAEKKPVLQDRHGNAIPVIRVEE